MKQGVLLDSSVWICYLRPSGWEDLKKAVKKLFTEERVYTCWVVKAELLVGARDEKAYRRLLSDLGILPEVPLTDQLWEKASFVGYALRRQGMSVPLPDLLVGQAAAEKNLLLWHVDEHFEQIRAVVPLHTKSWITE
ncbi:PIN domain nuclease [Acidobacteria bacterium AH-259-A15]|nr:PIN domain nuclease [Acidobacteria bacterium AH-259-A15]